MQVLLLGPVTVVHGERALTLRSARQASLLAALALDVGRPISRHRLIDAVWGEDPPATARNTLQVHVSSLRRVIGPEALEAVGDGYRLRGTREEVDVLRFADLVRQGLEAGAAGRHDEGSRLLRSALVLWRGDPLSGVDDTAGSFDAPRDRLRQLRLTASLARLDADLSLGRHLMLADELNALAAEYPYDENVAARQMLTHYRSGRQSDALAVYHAIVRLLRTDLGIDAGQDLRSLHHQILRHDQRLDRDLARATQSWRIPLDHTRGPIIGREALLAGLDRRMHTSRVHTLVGPSGIGKTRLAVELAVRSEDRFPDGAALVSADGLTSVQSLVDRLLDVVVRDPLVTHPGTGLRGLVEEARALVILDDLVPTPELRVELDAFIASCRSTFLATSARPTGLAGEQVTGVPPLDDGAAAELLLQRARSAGADLADDEPTRRAAERCARLVDGLPLAIELVAPLAVSGLRELGDTLLRRRDAGGAGGGVAVSFASSLQRLEPDEIELLDLLVSAGAPVDAELVAEAALEGALAALVRDGLVVRTVGTHGSGLFTALGQVRAHRNRTRGSERDLASRRLFVLTAARTVGRPSQYLPMGIASPARARRLVALEPALANAVHTAADLALADEAADIAVLLPELSFSSTGVAPRPGRSLWILDHPSLSPERRVDLLLGLSVEYQYDGQPERAVEASTEALRLVHDLHDPGRLAQVLAHRVSIELGTGLRLGSVDGTAREAVRAAEEHGGDDVLAGTLLLLYPTRHTSPDLLATLPRAVAAARRAGHAGLLTLALANHAAWDLDRGDPESAVVHAREAAALAEALHNRAAETIMRGTLQTAEALSGTGTGLSAVAAIVALSWERLETRTVTDALLKLAAGARRHRPDDLAGRCLGLYRALLVREAIAPIASEEVFAEQWLAGLEPVPPTRPLAEAVPALVRELTDELAPQAGPPSAQRL